MIERYSLPEMSNVWSDNYRFNLFKLIEITYLNILHKHLKINKKINLTDYKINLNRIRELEQTTKHEIQAFLDSLFEQDKKNDLHYLHYGLTSSDILDTATALQIQNAFILINEKIKELKNIFITLAKANQDTYCFTRTHGIQAEPATLGMKFVGYTQELFNLEKEIEKHYKNLKGKLSGPVGTYSTASPELEKRTLNQLGLSPQLAVSQIIHRTEHLDSMYLLLKICLILDKFATEFRFMSRTEISEIGGDFKAQQIGSSAMAHKKNPVSWENICGLSRVVSGYFNTAVANVNTWNERDISHSSNERLMFPDCFSTTYYILDRFIKTLNATEINVKNINNALDQNNGDILSNVILTEAIKNGISRKEAYSFIKENATSQSFLGYCNGHFKFFDSKYFYHIREFKFLNKGIKHFFKKLKDFK